MHQKVNMEKAIFKHFLIQDNQKSRFLNKFFSHV